MADIITFPNAATPAQRERCASVLRFVELEADVWSAEANISGIARNLAFVSRLSRNAPDKIREEFIARQEKQIAAMIEQAWIEGALRGATHALDAVRDGYVPKEAPAAKSDAT